MNYVYTIDRLIRQVVRLGATPEGWEPTTLHARGRFGGETRSSVIRARCQHDFVFTAAPHFDEPRLATVRLRSCTLADRNIYDDARLMVCEGASLREGVTLADLEKIRDLFIGEPIQAGLDIVFTVDLRSVPSEHVDVDIFIPGIRPVRQQEHRTARDAGQG